MTGTKELMQGALDALEQEQNLAKNRAIKEIIKLEKNYHYSKKGSSGRLREIRDIVIKYADEQD